MTNKHTPGPWISKGATIRADDESDALVASVTEYVGREYDYITQANARLIAAAPELLAALEQVAAALDDPRQGVRAAAYLAAQAAIAKAKGE